MARWLSLTTLLVVCFHLSTKDFYDVETVSHTKIPPCPTGKVCVIFTADKCEKRNNKWVEDDKTQNSDKTLGFLWGKSTCELNNYEKFEAGIDIEPVSLKTWKVAVTWLTDPVKQHADDIEFKFGDISSLTFRDDENAVFKWQKNGKEGTSKHHIHKTKFESTKIIWLQESKTEILNFNIYSFDIDANGEKLIELMSSEVKYIGKRIGTRTMNDTDFLEILYNKTFCDVSEVEEICFDEPCDKLAKYGIDQPGAEMICSSSLWMHSVDETMIRKWKKINKIRCEHGTWMADTITITQKEEENESEEVTQESVDVDSKTRRKREESEVTDPPKIATNTTESKAIDRSYEVQCSSEEPAKMTGSMKMILGFGISGALVLIIAVVAGVVVCIMLRRKKARENDFGTTKSHGGTTSKSKAGTPSGKAAH